MSSLVVLYFAFVFLVSSWFVELVIVLRGNNPQIEPFSLCALWCSQGADLERRASWDRLNVR